MKLIQSIFIFWTCLKLCLCSYKNNVCKSFSDYANIDGNKNCWYNPDVLSTPENIARNHGYEIQTHKVQTEDGYHLTIFRVQDKFSSAKKQPILIHHGMISSAVGFMTSGNKSLAFYLAKNGYDVWLANCRGNTYSFGHAYLKTTDPEYWNFSFHEMGVYDLPAVTEYIAEKTSNFTKIIYIGHSMGCTVCFIYSSLKKDHAEKYLKGVIAMAPGTSSKTVHLEADSIIHFANTFFKTSLLSNVTVVFPDPKKVNKIIVAYCRLHMDICLALLSLTAGKDEEQYSAEDLMVILSYHPSRTSVKSIVHFMQMGLTGTFLQYDHGKEKNLKIYNSVVPPEYPIENITIPVHIFYGKNDLLVRYEDILWTYNKLTTSEKSMQVVPKNPNVRYNHLNFLVSKYAERYLYKPLMRVIKKLDKK